MMACHTAYHLWMAKFWVRLCSFMPIVIYSDGHDANLEIIDMHCTASKHLFPYPITCVVACALLAGCGTTQKMSDDKLAAMGMRIGARHWEVTPQLFKEGYSCSVSGAKRENFDCAKTTGIFPTCILRVRFIVDDLNKISAISVPEPACLGTP
jgi:hypothetical protein